MLSDATIYAAVRERAHAVSRRLLCAGRRRDVLDDAIQFTYLDVRKQVRANVELAARLEAPEELRRYVAISLRNRLIALLCLGTGVRAATANGDSDWLLEHVADRTPTDCFDIEDSTAVVRLITIELARPAQNRILARRNRHALWVLRIFLTAGELPTHAQADSWFSEGSARLRRVAESTLRRQFGPEAVLELRRALAVLRPLLLSRAAGRLPEARQPGTDVGDVVSLVARFREAHSPDAYRERLNGLPSETFDVLADLNEGMDRAGMVRKLAARYAAGGATNAEPAPDDLRPAQLELGEHLRKVRQAFWWDEA